MMTAIIPTRIRVWPISVRNSTRSSGGKFIHTEFVTHPVELRRAGPSGLASLAPGRDSDLEAVRLAADIRRFPVLAVRRRGSGARTQNSVPSGSAGTAQLTSRCPISARVEPRARMRWTSASWSFGRRSKWRRFLTTCDPEPSRKDVRRDVCLGAPLEWLDSVLFVALTGDTPTQSL
jgi:hypothetical protein